MTVASALIAGQATTAFAFKNDTNNGPGAGKIHDILQHRRYQ